MNVLVERALSPPLHHSTGVTALVEILSGVHGLRRRFPNAG